MEICTYYCIEVLFCESPLSVGSDPCSPIIFRLLILACILVTNVQSCVPILVLSAVKGCSLPLVGQNDWLRHFSFVFCFIDKISSEAALFGQLSDTHFPANAMIFKSFIPGRESQGPINTQVTQVYCDPHTLTQDLFSILHAGYRPILISIADYSKHVQLMDTFWKFST